MSRRSTTRLAPALCPHCGHLIDGASPVSTVRGKPRPDDLTVCAYCAEVLQFDRQLVPRKPEPALLREAFSDDPELARETRAIQQAVRQVGLGTAGAPPRNGMH